MKYRPIIEPTAQRDLESIVDWIAADSPEQARLWYLRIQRAIKTLAAFPFRCSVAPESEELKTELRHLLFGRRRNIYRIIFCVRGRSVHVLHVRHSARQQFEED